MAKSSSSVAASFWRADWFAGVAMVIAVIVLHLTTDVIGALERRFYDLASSRTTRQPSDRIAIIAIDDQSIANLGRWPWPRDIHARLIDQLAAAKAKTIVYTVSFVEPEPDRSLGLIRKMKDVLASADAAASLPAAVQEQLAGVMAEAEAALDGDAQWAASLRNSGNVILPALSSPGQPAFALDSFDAVLSGKIPAAKYADKIVIIGVTAAGVGPHFAVPGNPALSPAEIIAHTTSSILSAHGMVQPSGGIWVPLAAFLLVGAYLILLLPRLSAGMAAIITISLFAALLGAEFGLLAGGARWFPLVLPVTLLLGGHLGLTTKRVVMRAARSPEIAQESADTQRMMGLALQGQGQLDMAFERFRRVPMGSAVKGDLQRLALDFERQRQFKQAEAVYRHLAVCDTDDTSRQAPVPQVQPPATTMLLGRYQVERELGKGTMGVVYLGKDPTIGRIVAIKTMALGEEFEGQALRDARERFFREAETAGRLQHQNIVTIFDAGEDHELAYIAMEFLKGKDLLDYCKEGQLLPVPMVLSIVARVAQALGYAHRQQVVHRDIKPANIMYDIASDTVKVTDFGIARITDASKTKTGLVWGTPSFMSPEQLAGKKVDGRSDLYSLGVMLFQMLTGVLPFRGESMAELMYKIANEAAPDIRIIRKELPPSLARLVAVSLRKSPDARYQDGVQLAQDLLTVLSAGTAIDLEI